MAEANPLLLFDSVWPSSLLLDCMDEDGNIDDNLCIWYQQYEQMLEMIDDDTDTILDNMIALLQEDSEEEANYSPPKKRQKRSCFRKQMNKMRDPTTGAIVEITPRMSSWYQTYVLTPDIESPKFVNRFRRRFRCSYDNYKKLLDLVSNDLMFQRWCNQDAAGRDPSPIELLLLGALRYLGRGWTFDDLEENTSISEECHRQFFHKFIRWASTELYKLYVITPSLYSESESHMAEMQEAGFDGCVGSVDATHICMLRCPYNRWNQHKGHKENMPARTYNIVVNHRRRILHSTSGHPSRWNDKTLAMFDNFLTDLNKGTVLNDGTFKLIEKFDNDQVNELEFRGSWLLCDNGYPTWSCLVPPMKSPIRYKEYRFSEWLESMRKDVECTFGILKGRFRILKTGIRLHGIEATDLIWLTCCALHNMFLDEDGLADRWENGFSTDWESELGHHNTNDVYEYCPNFAIQRLHTPDELRQLDLSGRGFGNDDEWDIDEQTEINENQLNMHEETRFSSEIRINTLSLQKFRNHLIDHFDAKFQLKLLKWPSRLKLKSTY